MDAIVQFVVGDAQHLTIEVAVRIALIFAIAEMLTRIIVSLVKVGGLK